MANIKMTWQSLFFYIVSAVFVLQIIAFIAGIDGVVTAACYGTFGAIAGATATIMVIVAKRDKSKGEQ